MNPVPASMPLSSDALVRYINYPGESNHIDAKGPIAWDNGVESAKLAKDIAAFANSRDGGAVVIGKEEPSPGDFILKGLTLEQADSFDTTKVATWVNNRFDPPIHLICHRQKYDGKLFVVITIAEFDDVPHLCVKSFDDPSNARKKLLKEKSIYVRNANAESALLGSVGELRELIGIAVKKKGDELVATFDAMLKGRPPVVMPNDEFQRELSEVTSDLEFGEHSKVGSWDLWFHPGTYDTNRWAELDELESLVGRHSLRIIGEFPPHYRGTHHREWGIANDFYGKPWALTRSGLFVCQHPFWENKNDYQNRYVSINGESEPPIPAGEWIGLQCNMRVLIEFFMFMSRITQEYEPGETVVYELRAHPLDGRKLAAPDFRIPVEHGPPEPCRDKQFQRHKTLRAEELRADWEGECAASLKQFYELFPEHDIKLETFRNWVEGFKKRDW